MREAADEPMVGERWRDRASRDRADGDRAGDAGTDPRSRSEAAQSPTLEESDEASEPEAVEQPLAQA